MIFTENNYSYSGVGLRGADRAAGKGAGRSRGGSGNDFLNNISEASKRVSEKNSGNTSEASGGQGNVSAQEEFSKTQGRASQLIDEAAKDGREMSREELLNIISEHREEILRKLKNGETGVKIAIGSLCLTEEEWEKLLDSFDEAQEAIQENVREESGEELPEKRPDTTINGNTVLAPEDTGHDLKSLEELVGESDIRGAVEEDIDSELQDTAYPEDSLRRRAD